MENNFYKLNGTCELVVGNHDPIPLLAAGKWFTNISMWKQFQELEMILTHVPIEEGSLIRPKYANGDRAVDKYDQSLWMKVLNVHGHLHSNPSPPGPYVGVSVEMIDYTPVNIESLAHK